MTTHKTWQQLVNNLREQRRHVLALIQLSRQQACALAEADIEQLGEINRQQVEHLNHLDILEQQRGDILQQLAHQLDLPADIPTLSDCVNLAPEPSARTLRWLQKELLNDLQQLQSLSARNQAILQQASETVNTWLALVVHTVQSQAGYQPESGASVAIALNTEV